NGLELLGVNDITSFDGTFSLTNLTTDSQQTTLLSSASMHATISKTLFDLGDSVLIVPSRKQDNVTDIRQTVSLTEFVVKLEIKALLNAFTTMGYTNLNGFGSGIDSTKFFTDTDTILLSSSIQATLSDQLLNQTGGSLIIPNEDIASNPIRMVVGSVEYVDLDELLAIMNALDLLDLTDFDSISITPTILFTVDLSEIFESVTMQATISDSILDNASNESGSAGSLIVPDFFRETLPEGITTTVQIEKTELIALLDSLEALGISDFSDAVSPTLITSMTDQELDTMLASGSMHTTIDYMINDNPNVSIPNKAKQDQYDITGITLKAEVKAFIKAANTFGATDFSTASFDLNAILLLDAGQRGVVLDSMIVRNIVTPDIQTAVSTKNALNLPLGPFYTIPNTDYEDSDPLTFLTKQGILDALVFIES
ncbi:MAG: hypothetical protein Q8M70_04655, partial [bacterium]|nr:hypothetical protein [bacterium]